MSDVKNINLSISEGDAFFSNEMSINFNPMSIFLDFKSITPRIDQRNSQGPTFSLKHNVVVLDAFSAKQFYHMLSKALERYEKEFGKIKKSRALEKAEKKGKKKVGKQKAIVPGYFG